MTITAALVKELRERTGLGMMECKKALVESDGDIELAIENLRKSGQAKAAKKAGRTAAEGAVMTKTSPGYGIILEVNSETDFVARDDNFGSFVDQVSGRILALKQTDVEQLLASTITANDTVTIEEARQALVQKVGENIQLRRVASLEGELVGSYLHNQKIGVLVALQGGDSDLARDVAMHIAATNPMVTNPQEIPQAVLDKEKEIFSAQARESGKPEAVIEKMIDGRLKKFMAEVSLTEQSFVKDPDQTVGALLKQKNAAITGFVRFEVGEGIEKEEKDFAAEVMAQVNG